MLKLKTGELVRMKDDTTPNLDFFENSKVWDAEFNHANGYFDFEDVGIVLEVSTDWVFVNVLLNTGLRGWVSTRILERIK